MMSKSRFDVSETAKQFISDIRRKETLPDTDDSRLESDRLEVEKVKTRQVGFYITEEQNMSIAFVAIKRKTDKSSIVREALNQYIEKMKIEGIL
jgi:hypothetical protein